MQDDVCPLPYHRQTFAAQVYAIVAAIPPGRVLSYGEIAHLSGYPSHSRMVGRVLKTAPKALPCHRVVNSRGSTAAGWKEQRTLLENEGVLFLPSGRVDRSVFGWKYAQDTIDSDKNT